MGNNVKMNMTTGHKTCGKCGETKPLDGFSKDRRAKDGVQSKCKTCNKAYREANAEKIAATKKKWEQANPEKGRAAQAKYYQKNPKRRAVIQRRWNDANRDKVNATASRRRTRKAGNGVYLILDKEIRRLYASPCVACGATENIQLDHIIPVIKGGTTSIGNSQPLCKSCNSSKCDKLMIEWRAA